MSSTIPGLFYFPDAVTGDILASILDFLASCEMRQVRPGVAASREVAQFGSEYDYRTGAPRAGGGSDASLPEALQSLIQIASSRLREVDIDTSAHPFTQCIVNRYLSGQGIGRHIDHPAYGPYIACFTFGSAATMLFTHPDGRRVDVPVAPGSLYVMTGDARSVWSHEMPSRLTDPSQTGRVRRDTRTSVTFRHYSA